MNLNADNTEEVAGEGKSSLFFEVTRKIILAAVGAAVVVQDEISGFVDNLAERGEIAEQDARRLLKEVQEHREKLLKEKRARREQYHPRAATKKDIEDLTARIADLNRQIEELRKGSPESTV